MTIQAIGTFIRLTTPAGAVRGLYQNCTPSSTASHEGERYGFLSFAYQGATRNRMGDNMESQLLLASNALSMNIVREAVTGRWTIRVDTLAMHPETYAPGKLLSRDYWLATALSYDPQNLEVLLSSAIDAVGVAAPLRVLTESQVGQLPVSAAIRNS